jgi:hypothetical protein
MNKTLKSFVDYCEKNKSLRFWQALASWSGYNFIYGSYAESRDEALDDTFYIEDEK